MAGSGKDRIRKQDPECWRSPGSSYCAHDVSRRKETGMIAVDDMVAAARAATEQDWRWASVVARDRAADGKFLYSVRTTGVYCRPSCAARLARPENVRFHPTRAEAERAGFRPCKRCKPDQPSPAKRHAVKVAEACR